MSSLQIEILPVLNDNYMYLLRDPATGVVGVVDPPVAGPVLERLAELDWRGKQGEIDWILSTHHHPDHTAGNLELKERTGCQVAGPAAERERIPGIDVALSEGDLFSLGERAARIFDTPGHTAGHISYWFDDSQALFCADTLFALGCGRLFEGSAEQMWLSLQKLLALPNETLVYCGHEYTLSNARFATSIDPDNSALAARAAEVEKRRQAGEPTVPSRLGEEKATNPFLRPFDEGIRSRLGMQEADDAEVFGEIRRRKDEA
ncbi:MAG: hydroxyacylglutathione hydrolase [Acidobacteria bacterium]|nr:MAG: hydroxyacylglutathione hydrolase [Acidobacteriota bacterium]REK07919.1 MAG: hydroxyacylglutathione hydrolase [Acidobacteriota bacterium]